MPPSRRPVLFSLLTVLALVGLPVAAATLQLRLPETTDLHMNMVSPDYSLDKPMEEFGTSTLLFAENLVAGPAEVPGIGVILFGHSHDEFPGPFFGRQPKVDLARGTINGIPDGSALYEITP